MKKIVLALAVCFLLGSISAPPLHLTAAQTVNKQTVVAISQEPVDDPKVAKLVIKGPTKVKAGDLVVISVEESRAASFKWKVLPSTDNFLVIDQGKRVVFSSGVGGEFKFIVACSLGDTCDVAVHTVTVVGGKPSVVNDLDSKIARWCESVQSDTLRDDVLKLAQSFSSVAMVMDGGTLTTPKEIVDATRNSNRDALGDKSDAWEPFKEQLRDELTRMAAAGQLKDTQSHIRVWRAIAAALRDYADKL